MWYWLRRQWQAGVGRSGNLRVVVWVLAAALLPVLAGSAGAQGGGLPDPATDELGPAPWHADALRLQAASPGEDIIFSEHAITQDTYVASREPFDKQSFMSEKSVWVGTHAEMGDLRAELAVLPPQSPPGGVLISATLYLPFTGADHDAEFPLTVWWAKGWGVFWANQPPVVSPPLGSLTIAEIPKWYSLDITAMTGDWYPSTGGSRTVELRGPETKWRAVRGMWAVDAGPDAPVPVVVAAFRPDRTAPVCHLAPLPDISTDAIVLHPNCSDDAAGVAYVQYELSQNGGPWQSFASNPGDAYTFKGYGGQTYAFRVRAFDKAGNVGAFQPEEGVSTTVESWPPVVQPVKMITYIRANSDSGTLVPPVFWMMDTAAVQSGIKESKLAYADHADGVWHEFGSWSGLALEPGHTYTFWARAVDNAGNVSPWTTISVATAYLRLARGGLVDAGSTVAGFPVHTLPQTLNVPVTDDLGHYELYLVSEAPHQILETLPGMRIEPPLPAGKADLTGQVQDFVVEDDPVKNGGFDAPLPGTWDTTGPYAVRQQRTIAATDHAARLGAPPEEHLLAYSALGMGCLALASDGSLHVGFVAKYLDNGQQRQAIFHTWRSQGDLDWRPIAPLDTSLGAVNSILPSCLMASTSDGRVHLAYRAPGLLPASEAWRYRVREPDGSWGASTIIASGSLNDIAALIGDATGAVHAIRLKQDYAVDDSLFYLQRTPQGLWLPEVKLPAAVNQVYISSGASLLIGENGVRHLLFGGRNRGQAPGLFYTSSADGQQWEPLQLVPCTGPAEFGVVALRQNQSGELFAFSSQLGDYRAAYSVLANEVWSQPRFPGPNVSKAYGQAMFAVDLDDQGRWRLLIQDNRFAAFDSYYEGFSLDNLALKRSVSGSSGPAALVAVPQVASLLRLSKDLIVLRIPADRPPTLAALGQSLTVPADIAAPVLTWEEVPYGLDVEVTARVQEAEGEWQGVDPDFQGLPGLDLSPWRGREMAFQLGFTPGSDLYAGIWLDNFRVAARLLNVAIAITSTLNLTPTVEAPAFEVGVQNRRSYTQSTPVEVTWPLSYTFDSASVQPTVVEPGRAVFDLSLPAEESLAFHVILEPPATVPSGVLTVTAELMEPERSSDYTPADNRATARMVMAGLPIYLPRLTGGP